MSEPELIRSSAPHSVSVSQGSKVAGGNKSAEHSVRNTLAGEDPAPIQQQEAPEIKLSPRIKPAAAPAQPDLPPPVASHAKEEGEATPLPAAFHSAEEPQAGGVFEQRSIQDDVQHVQGDVPGVAGAADQDLVPLPEALADPASTAHEEPPAPPAGTPVESFVALPESLLAEPEHEAPAAPVTERVQADHRVGVPESLAADEQPAPEAPVVERSEQDHRASLPEPLPETDVGQAPDAPVLTHSQQDHHAELPQALAEPGVAPAADAPVLDRSHNDTVAAVPVSLAGPAGEAAEGLIVSRASSDTVVELPPEQAAPEEAAEGPVVSRHEEDHLVAVPEGQASVSEPATGPEISRAVTDKLLAVPEAVAAQPADQGPLITRSQSDNLLAVPEAEPQRVSDPEMPPPVSARAEMDLPAATPQAEFIEIVEVAQVEEAERLPVTVEPAAELSPPALQPTEHQLVQMNFPARVIKLKIANDKVRVQLDALEAPERPRR